MRSRLHSILLFLMFLPLASFSVSTSLHAQGNVKLSGSVRDPDGRTITGAHIRATLVATSGGASSQTIEADTGASGEFSVSLAPGKYRVEISLDSFQRVTREVDLSASAELNLQLQLEPLSSSVVVTAQPEPAEVTQTPAPVDEISLQKIQNREAFSLPDLLATEPGFGLARTGPEGGQATLFLDGGNSNYAKVLVDGIPANDSGGFIDFSNFTLNGVDKIEVVHGAESAIYGSDAMTGAIQVFTHRGDTAAPELTLTADGGSFSTGDGDAQFSGLLAHGKFDYSAAAGYFSTAGQGPNDAFLNRTFSGNFGWKFSDDDTLRFTLRDNSSTAGIPGQTLYGPPALNQQSILHDFLTGLTWNAQTGKHWHWRVQGTESSLHSINSDEPFFVSSSQFNRASFDGQTTYSIRDVSVTAGYYYEVENGFPGALSGEHARRNNQAGYLDFRWQPVARLTLNAGVRAEDNASFGTRTVPRAGATYLLRERGGNFGATRLHGFYGQGIDEPRLDQSFGTDPCFPGNPNLSPEQSKTGSFGISQHLANNRVSFSADYFYNEFHDLISFAFMNATPACIFGTGTFFNTDLAIARGTNITVETRLARWLSLAGHYTFDDSRVLLAPNATDSTEIAGNRLFRRPVNSGTVELNANWRQLNFNVLGYITGQRTDSDFLGLGFTRNPGYSRFDLAASYQIRRRYSLFLRAGNVLNRQYQDALGFPALGREIRGGVRLKFAGLESP